GMSIVQLHPTTTKNTHMIRAPDPAAMARRRDLATVSSSGSPASVWWERREEGARWTRGGEDVEEEQGLERPQPRAAARGAAACSTGGDARCFGLQRGVAARVGRQRGVG